MALRKRWMQFNAPAAEIQHRDERVGRVESEGLSGFPNAETLNLTMSYVDVGLIGHRVQTRKGPV